jgi:hypothetical protein
MVLLPLLLALLQTIADHECVYCLVMIDKILAEIFFVAAQAASMS